MKQNIQRFALGSVLTLLAVQLSGCSTSQGIEPSKVTCNQFMQKMQAKQLSAAYSLLSSKLKSTSSTQKTQKYWDALESNAGKVQSWSETGFKVYSGTGGSNVILGYDLKCAKGAGTATFQCVEENGKWLIQGYNYNFKMQ